MSIRSRLLAVALIAGAASAFVLPRGNAQQATPSPARRAGSAAITTRTPVLVPRTVAEGGGYKTEYTEEQRFVMTPELQQLYAEEIQAAESAQSNASALAKLPANASESDREGLKAALRDALVRQFDAQQKRRSEEIASIEERLGKLKETLQKRGAAKDAIVGKRLDQLTGVKDDLAWEETRPVPHSGYGKFPTAPGYTPNTLPPAGSTIVAPPTLERPLLPTQPAWPAQPYPATIAPAPVNVTPVPAVAPPAPATSAAPAPPAPAPAPAPAAVPAPATAPAPVPPAAPTAPR